VIAFKILLFLAPLLPSLFSAIAKQAVSVKEKGKEGLGIDSGGIGLIEDDTKRSWASINIFPSQSTSSYYRKMSM
jgi:hypothetical protein